MSQWWAQSMFLAKCLPMSLPNLSTGAVWCFSIFFFNICLVVLRRSVWAGSRFLRCLSDENLANVFSGLSSVSANISLVSLVAVFPKCLSMSAAKSVYRSCLTSSRINPRFFFQYLSSGLMCSIWAGSQLCLPISSWWESCWCLSGLSSASANVFLVSSVDVFHEVSPNVFCQICLQEPLDVFQDQPTVFLPVFV